MITPSNGQHQVPEPRARCTTATPPARAARTARSSRRCRGAADRPPRRSRRSLRPRPARRHTPSTSRGGTRPDNRGLAMVTSTASGDALSKQHRPRRTHPPEQRRGNCRAELDRHDGDADQQNMLTGSSVTAWRESAGKCRVSPWVMLAAYDRRAPPSALLPGDSRRRQHHPPAAARLHLSQPALSRTLAQLDERSGDPSRRPLDAPPDAHRRRQCVRNELPETSFSDSTRPSPRSVQLCRPFSWVQLEQRHARHGDRAVVECHVPAPAAPVPGRRRAPRWPDRRTRRCGPGPRPGDRPGIGLEPSSTTRHVWPHCRSEHRLADATDVSLTDLNGETLIINSITGTTTLDLWPEPPRPTIGADLTTIDDWLIAVATSTGIGITVASTAVAPPASRHSVHPDPRCTAGSAGDGLAARQPSSAHESVRGQRPRGHAPHQLKDLSATGPFDLRVQSPW